MGKGKKIVSCNCFKSMEISGLVHMLSAGGTPDQNGKPVLPITVVSDGGKPKPIYVLMKHCPFCGKELKFED